jgi:putative ABC transport system ATP-binding protein
MKEKEMNTIIKAENVSKSYVLGRDNETLALNSVSLEIKKGEFVSVMGPSGSGKSTLLYSISGMDRISGGHVSFDGESIGNLTEKEMADLRLTKMGFVFQQSNLLKNLSIFDNIIVAAYLNKRAQRNRINERAMDLMDQTGIAHLKDNDITQASGGELQRASICRALINEPMIVFGDEPTGALNSSASKEVMEIFRAINQSGGTILIVTHDARIAAYSDRVLFMADGQIAGEYNLDKYSPEEPDKRESELSEWLAMMGF